MITLSYLEFTLALIACFVWGLWIGTITTRRSFERAIADERELDA